MWKTLFKNLHCNRFLQEKLFANVPYPPHQYWTQWLVLEESVPLPVVRLPTDDIQAIWGIGCEALKPVEGMPGILTAITYDQALFTHMLHQKCNLIRNICSNE